MEDLLLHSLVFSQLQEIAMRAPSRLTAANEDSDFVLDLID